MIDTNITNIFETLLAYLGAKLRIFHSEDDLKFVFDCGLQEYYTDEQQKCNVLLEYPTTIGKKSAHVDIVLEMQGRKIPLELKYKTNLLNYQYNSQEIVLKYHSAPDIGRYHFLRDIWRLEQLLDSPGSGFGPCGYALLLTNDVAYWESRSIRKKETNDREFRIHEGCEALNGNRCWWQKEKDSKKIVRLEENFDSDWHPLNFRSSYPIQWQDYATIGGTQNNIFRYALVRVASR